jgi:hypothetical protein
MQSNQFRLLDRPKTYVVASTSSEGDKAVCTDRSGKFYAVNYPPKQKVCFLALEMAVLTQYLVVKGDGNSPGSVGMAQTENVDGFSAST